MKASVIIPTYNDRMTISRAIDSALRQTLDNFEIIVVNDGSTDGTGEILQTYSDKIKMCAHNRNQGGAAARNTGIRHAKGDHVAFLDADDEWLPTKLEKQIKYLNSKGPEWVAVYCDFRSMSGDRNVIHEGLSKILSNNHSSFEGGDELIRKIFQRRFTTGGASTLVIERDTIEKLNGFDESFPRHQDIELLIRLLKIGKLAHLDEMLVIKHNTGVPDPEKVKKADIILFNKFQKDIERLADAGIDIRGIHNCKLAQRYYHHGELRQGTNYLIRAKFFNKLEVLRVIRELVVGVKNNLNKFI